jgi:GTP cyclohydrolase I
MDAGMIEHAVRMMLTAIGEDPDREGLVKTPERVAHAWLSELFAGYNEDPEQYMMDFDNEGYDELIIVTQIPFVSHCEHHVMPFTGTVDVGYIPEGRIIGLSKIPRLVNTFSRRLQVQERLTNQIADALETYLRPKGAMVVVHGMHSCMCYRGVKAHGAGMITSAVRGVFLDPTKGAREEFLRLTQ